MGRVGAVTVPSCLPGRRASLPHRDRGYRDAVTEPSDVPAEDPHGAPGDVAHRPPTPATSEPSTLKTAFVLCAVLVAAVQIVLITSAAMPPNRASEALRPATSYQSPFFTQNWRLFAPSPISSDRSVLFQAAYEVDGELVTTDWVDWTDVELGAVRRHVIGGRAGYVTNKFYSALAGRHRALSDEQRRAVEVVDPASAPSWEELEQRVTDAATDAAQEIRAARWLTYEESVIALGSAVVQAREPDAQLVAVRYRLRSQAVTPYADRRLPREEREAARPAPVERTSGWRAVLSPSEAELDAVERFDRRHR